MFRLIEDSFWDDPPIAALPRDEKLVLVCLFTNIHTRPCGVYRIGLDRLAGMVRVPEAVVAKGLKHLAEGDLVYYDGLEVCIPGYIRRQRYKGPQIARRIAVELAQVKNKSFAKMIVDRYPDFLKMGGFKLDGLEIAAPQKELKLESDEPAKTKKTGIGDLVAFVATRLRFTGGVKSTILARLVKMDPAGEEGVRAAVKRAEKYYETAKAEKWKAYIIARRFSKFCEFYGEAFSSDEALQTYIEKIRLANERESRKDAWHKKREAAAQVGAQRAEPEQKDHAASFMQRFPEALEPLRKDFEAYFKGKKKATQVKERLLAVFENDAEIKAKATQFMKGLPAANKTQEMEKTYRLNYLIGKYGIPEIEDTE